MGYTRTWISPSPPHRNNEAAWKAICQDIHNSMVDAGLVWVPVDGQLESFDGVYQVSVPDKYFGFRVYRFNDDLANQGKNIFIRLDYGVAVVGLSSVPTAAYNIPGVLSVKVQVGTDLDISGNVKIGVGPPISYRLPQTYVAMQTGSGTGSPYTQSGNCVLCLNYETGFFSFSHGLGDNGCRDGGSRYYEACNMQITIQRNLTDGLTPKGDGFSVLYPIGNAIGSGTVYTMASYVVGSYTSQVTYSGSTSTSETLMIRMGNDLATAPGGRLVVSPCYSMSPYVTQIPTVVSLSSSVPFGTQFEIEVQPGTFMNFMCIGNRSLFLPLTPGTRSDSGQFAILWQ